MSEQAQQKAQSESSHSGAEIAAVAAILAAGPPLAMALKAISAVAKLPKKLVLGVLSVLKYKPGKKALPGSGIAAEARKRNLRYRAAYLLNATDRLAAADDLDAALQREKALFASHKEASKRRVDSAKGSAKMVVTTRSNILGWGGILDDRTTPDCRWLIGKNYAADNPPEGLHPGGRHPRCRCYPTPAYIGKPVVTKLPGHLTGNSPL